MYQNILLAVDFSKAAASVAQRAVRLADVGAKLTLLHVVEYLPILDFSGDPVAMTPMVIDDDLLLDNARQSLQSFVDEHLSDVAVEQQVCLGLPKLDILRVVEEQEIDLLVIGSHGRHGFARLLGSTAAAVLNDCPCDVLAVRVKD
ncbi:Universal stress protein family COG0589 [hydrothermal vent metagenome]|uniref:Universal stress protein family COG0589 n=1 Tax=hydrothermal vent metagenome TaxID=652676 RepID=A0A3B0ZBN2_9ZZZZ